MLRTLSSVAVAAALLLGSVAPASAAMLVVKLNAVGGSGQNGRAVLRDLPPIGPAPRVSVSATVANEPPPAIEPSHIHRGICGSNGPILRPLHNVVHGQMATTIVTGFTVAQLHAMHTYINIHKSPVALGVIVSCGTI
jgi:hypothetical protein